MRFSDIWFEGHWNSNVIDQTTYLSLLSIYIRNISTLQRVQSIIVGNKKQLTCKVPFFQSFLREYYNL